MKHLIIVTFLFSLSCNSETPTQNDPEITSVTDLETDVEIDESQDLNAKDRSDDSFPFPQLQTLANCIGPTKPKEFCEWGVAAYDIVLLEITETSQIISPILDTKTNSVVEKCEGNILTGFRMEGIVKQSVKGLAGSITVDVGIMQTIDAWSPLPVAEPSEDGTVKWSDGVGIQVGDVIGLTLHKHPTEETLGILGEHFFDISPKNTVRFGELHSECGTPPPENASGLTFAKLKEEIKKCVPSTLADDRKRVKEQAWQYPEYSNLGTCYSNK